MLLLMPFCKRVLKKGEDIPRYCNTEYLNTKHANIKFTMEKERLTDHYHFQMC